MQTFMSRRSYGYVYFFEGGPLTRTGRLCIEVAPSSKIAFISETLCIGCGIVRILMRSSDTTVYEKVPLRGH